MLIGSVTNYGSLQGNFGNAEALTGFVSSASMMGGQVVGMRGLKGDKGDKGDTGEKGDEPVITATRDSEIGVTHIYCDGISIATILDGADGETPDIATYRDVGVTYITSNGITIGAVYDGEKGDTGDKGDTGAAGHSPVVTATKVGKVTTVYVDGTAIATINDGQDGTGVVTDVTQNGVSVLDGTVAKVIVPMKVSDLTNDSGFISSESDPVFTASPAYGISASDISTWNGKSDFSGDYDDLTNKPTIPSKVSDLVDDSNHVDKTNPYYDLDTTAAAGTTDGDLYAAITALGWESEVIV